MVWLGQIGFSLTVVGVAEVVRRVPVGGCARDAAVGKLLDSVLGPEDAFESVYSTQSPPPPAAPHPQA